MEKLLEGIGPDASTVVNEQGGRQSKLVAEFDILPWKGILQVALIMTEASKKYGKDNWRKIARVDHLNHALAHLCAYCMGDNQDDHLGHAATRILFALETV